MSDLTTRELRSLDVLSQRVDDFAERIKKVETVIGGNGRPGLDVRVSQLEQRVEDSDSHMQQCSDKLDDVETSTDECRIELRMIQHMVTDLGNRVNTWLDLVGKVSDAVNSLQEVVRSLQKVPVGPVTNSVEELKKMLEDMQKHEGEEDIKRMTKELQHLRESVCAPAKSSDSEKKELIPGRIMGYDATTLVIVLMLLIIAVLVIGPEVLEILK